jgi:hypothetical protein
LFRRCRRLEKAEAVDDPEDFRVFICFASIPDHGAH